MRKLVAIAVLGACAALPASASAGKYPEPTSCGIGEPAYTGWNYTDLKAYGLKCSIAHDTAEKYVYEASTEGVIEPPNNFRRCKEKKVADGLWKTKCTRMKGDEPQKITFVFGGPEQFRVAR